MFEPRDARRLREMLRAAWRRMKEDTFLDRERAELKALGDYPELFVQRGMVLASPRDKPYTLDDVLERYEKKVGYPIPRGRVQGGWRSWARRVFGKKK